MKQVCPHRERRLLGYDFRFSFCPEVAVSVVVVAPSGRQWEREREKKKARFVKSRAWSPLFDLTSIALDWGNLLTRQGIYSVRQDEWRVLHGLQGCALLNLSLSPFWIPSDSTCHGLNTVWAPRHSNQTGRGWLSSLTKGDWRLS